jgi:hypothetical protein
MGLGIVDRSTSATLSLFLSTCVAGDTRPLKTLLTCARTLFSIFALRILDDSGVRGAASVPTSGWTGMFAGGGGPHLRPSPILALTNRLDVGKVDNRAVSRSESKCPEFSLHPNFRVQAIRHEKPKGFQA